MNRRVLFFHLFGSGGTFYDQLFQKPFENRLERRGPEPERKVHDLRPGWDRQPRVADYQPIRMPQPGQGVNEPRVYYAALFQNSSTVSGVGSAPWAPSFVTAAAPARTA